MNLPPRHNVRKIVVAFLFALIVLIVVVPLVYDLAGVRTNLEEQIVPTFAAQQKARTRATRAPTQNAPFISPAENAPVPPPTEIAQPPGTPSVLNGIPISRILWISESTQEHLRDIFALGQSLGRNPRAVSKVGDSTMLYPPFLATFDNHTFSLGKYAYLQRTIAYHTGSFGRRSAAVKIGMHTWSQFDPAWSPPELCAAGEVPLACEVRLNNPAVAIIRLGANDTDAPQLFEQKLDEIVEYCLARGIIPVLGTKPDRFEGQSNLLNNLIRKTASAYSIPLWDYDLIAATVPGRGLDEDQLHMRGGGTRNFKLASALQAGDALEDLTALMMLDAIRREVGAAP